MTVSADRRLRHALIPLALLLAGTAPAALAQGSNAPVSLVPPSLGGPAPDAAAPRDPQGPAPMTAPAPLGPEVAPASPVTGAPAAALRAPSGLEVEELRPVSAEAAGTLGPDNGGLSTDLWGATPRPEVERLLAELPARLASPALRAAARRLLLTAGTPPAGEGTRNLAALRLQKLASLGDVAGTAAMLDVAPAALEDEEAAAAWMALTYLAGDSAAACGHVGELLGRFNHAIWQKYQIVCQVQAGDADTALLGIDMLRELGDKDDTFFRLAEIAASGQKPPVKGLSEPTPPQLALILASGRPLPADLKPLGPAESAAIARSATVPAAQRAAAAERALRLGSLETAGVQTLLEGLEPGDARTLPAAARKPTPLIRLQLLKAALAEPLPSLKGGLLKAAVQAADPALLAGPYGSLLADEVRTLPVNVGYAVIAPHAARLLLLQDRLAEAQPWIELARADARAGKDEGAWGRLWPLAAAYGLVRESEVDQGAWVAGLAGGGSDAAAARDKADGVLLVLSALTGTALPDAGMEAGPKPQGVAVAEALAILAASGGDGGPAQASPLDVQAAVATLKAAGLEDVARRVAVEAMAGRLGA